MCSPITFRRLAAIFRLPLPPDRGADDRGACVDPDRPVGGAVGRGQPRARGPRQGRLLVAAMCGAVSFSMMSANAVLATGTASATGSLAQRTTTTTNDPGAGAVQRPGQPDDAEAEAVDEGAASDVRIPQVVTRETLPNGVNLLLQDVPGVEHVAILAVLGTGEMHDPADAPGLAQTLDNLVMTSGVDIPGVDATNNPDAEPRLIGALDYLYKDGWAAQALPQRLSFGIVVPSAQGADEVRRLVNRLQFVTFTEADLRREVEVLRREVNERFEVKKPLVPISWLMAKTFRHVSDPWRGIDPDAVAALPVERVQEEWDRRRHPRNMTAVLIGDLRAEEGAVRQAARDAFGALQARGEIPTEVTVQPVGNVRREIFVPHLPGDDDHIAMAFYAPPITDPDHPAFLAMSQQFIDDAKNMQGAEARLPYQYSMLLDPRAAYLTPHAWRFPKGPGQAGGYWLDKIAKRRFSSAIGRATLGRLIWQLGGELKGEFVEEVARTPELLYTLGFATAFREAYGDESFWENYRATLYKIRGRDLDRNEDLRKKFFADTNRTLFVLRAVEAGAEDGGGGAGADPRGRGRRVR